MINIITYKNPAIKTGINGIAKNKLVIIVININTYIGLPEYSKILK
jgi:hypothetical protein